MKEYNYTVFFEPMEGGGYNVVVPAIPEICTFGETIDEARSMAEDAIRCYVESTLELGEEVPKDVIIEQEPFKTRLAITLEAA
jgi:antitoxin HicB